jgi:hypothetical protein
MKTILLALSLIFFFPSFVQAQVGPFVTTANTPTSAPNTNNVFGDIEAPPGVAELNADAEGIGLLLFISNMIKLASIIAGVWVLFNFISAGFTYITSADSSAYSKIGEKLSMSVMGLVLIVASYTIIGIISLIIFGNPTYIINPEIPTAINTP